MMILAQALQVVRIGEALPVSTMRLNVVDYCRPCPLALPRALPAERLLQQVFWPDVLRPDRVIVPAVVLCADPALVYRSVPITEAVTREHAAAWMSAWSQWLLCHLLTSQKKKPVPA